jgi:hypothetical protein
MGLFPRFFLVRNFATFRLAAQTCKMYKGKVKKNVAQIATIRWMVMIILPFFKSQGMLGPNLS